MSLKINSTIRNRKASFDYFFLKEFVAGIQLYGTEVKAIKDAKVSIVDTFCYFNKGELFVKGMNITEGTFFSHSPMRDRKLLLKRKELDKLENELIPGLTIIVKKIFFSDRGKIKVEIALAKGKKSYDKRNSIKDRESARELRSI